MDYGLIAICISGILFAFNVFDRVWGGGNRAAQSASKVYVDLEVATLRKDVFLKHDDTAGNVGAALQGLRDTAHKMQLEAMEFRAIAAETYMRRDSYYKAMGELKADVNVAFNKIDQRLERMENTIASNRREDHIGRP